MQVVAQHLYYGHNVRDQKFLNKFAKNLKLLRAKRRMTQEQLALESGLSLSQIARNETGRLNTSISTAYVQMKALGVEANDLFRDK
jgi:transcriptional regulator with XRE-family HTH domain